MTGSSRSRASLATAPRAMHRRLATISNAATPQLSMAGQISPSRRTISETTYATSKIAIPE